MPSPQGPLLPRRRLGAELKRLRGDRTLDEVAAETLISTSKLSRLENGQGVPQPRDIRDLINFYGADRATGGPPPPMDERRAPPGLVEGVLGRHLGLAGRLPRLRVRRVGHPHLHADGTARPPADGGVRDAADSRRSIPTERTRADRQARRGPPAPPADPARRRDDATRLLAVVDEAAVRRALADELQGRGPRYSWSTCGTVSRRRNVSFRIIPLDAGLHAGVIGMFTDLPVLRRHRP